MSMMMMMMMIIIIKIMAKKYDYNDDNMINN